MASGDVMSVTSADPIVEEIAVAGDLTRQASARYQEIFRSLRQRLKDALDRASDPADRARAAMTIADAAAAAFAAHFPNQPAIDCRAGCDACCHLPVMIPPGVAEAICAHLVERLDPDALAALKAELAQAAAAADALADPSTLRRRCPLLGADGRCTVYAVRPLTCRAFTSPSAAACRALAFDAGRPVPQSPSQYQVYIDATAALERAAAERGLPSRQMGLAAGLLAVLPGTGSPPQA